MNISNRSKWSMGVNRKICVPGSLIFLRDHVIGLFAYDDRRMGSGPGEWHRYNGPVKNIKNVFLVLGMVERPRTDGWYVIVLCADGVGWINMTRFTTQIGDEERYIGIAQR